MAKVNGKSKNTGQIVSGEFGESCILPSKQALPNLVKQTRRSLLEVSGDGAYDTRASHAAIKIKRAVALVPPKRRGSLLGARPPSESRRGQPEVIRLK